MNKFLLVNNLVPDEGNNLPFYINVDHVHTVVNYDPKLHGTRIDAEGTVYVFINHSIYHLDKPSSEALKRVISYKLFKQ